MQEPIIDRFFDKSQILKDINEIAAEMSKKFGAAANINTLGGKSSGSASQKAEFDSMVEANKRLVKQLNEYKVQMEIVSKATAQARVETNNLNAQQKLQGTLYAKNATELQKLDAQIKLLNIDLQKLVASKQTESKAYTDGMAKMRQLSNEYDRMSKASGQAMLKTSSMYGATFSLTQVMRELPNFAIDARIGFMALSNNLPMLAENFTRVTKEIDEITGKEKGFKGALKEFGKSLLSLNTIMIVVSTVLVLFGEDIMNWISTIGDAENAALKFAKSLNEIEKEVGDMLKKDLEGINKFAHDYRKAIKDGDAEMIKSLEERGIKEYDLNKEQLKQIVSDKKAASTEMFDDYLKKAEDAYFNEIVIKKKVDAQMAGELSLKKAQDLFRATSDTKSVKGVKSTGLFGTKKLDWNFYVKHAMNGTLSDQAWEALFVYGVDQTIIDELANVNAQNKILKDLPKLRNAYVSKLEKKEVKGRIGSKQFTEINVTREYYKSEEELMRRLADLQNDITRENENGEINSYEKRRKAAELYYNTVTTLAMGEQNVAIANVQSQFDSDKSGIQTKYQNNKKKFKKGSPEYIKNEEQYTQALKTLEANRADEILKINDKYIKEYLDAEKKKAKETLAIEDDIYKEKVYYIEQEAKLNSELQAAIDKQQSIGGTALSALGLNKYKNFQDAANRRSENIQSIKDKLKGAKGTDKESLERELDFANQQDMQQRQLDAIQITEDAKASIVSDSIDTLKSLWDSYYAYLEEQVDNQLKKDTKVNDERLAQYEDETKAGLHTAQELDNYKERSVAYQTSLEEEAARKKKELEKEQFLLSQAFALGQIWINFAINSTKYPELIGLLLGQAIASTALVAAQTIPAFAEGGDMDKAGIALLGDGGKHELAISPSGKMFISGNTPQLYDLEKGTHIFPDVNKVDLMSVLAMKQAMPNIGAKGDDRLMRELISTVKGQKQGNFYGMPLIRQMNMSDRYSARKRSLMN